MKKFAPITLAILIALSMPTVFTAQVQAWVEPGLYAGISNPASVYRYDGTSWTLIGTFADDYAVLCLVDYMGELYAGTMSDSYPFDGIGRVYRYDGGTTWTLVGDNLSNETAFLVVYDGNLYAGTAGDGRLYRYDGGTTWTLAIDLEIGYGLRSAFVYGDMLLFAEIMQQAFYHTTDGVTYTEDVNPFVNCEGIYDYEVYDGYLYAAAGLEVDLYRSSDGTTWSPVIPIGYPNPTTPGYEDTMRNWELETFNEYLYMSIDNGTLAIWDGSSHSNVWVTPDEQSIISMDCSFDCSRLYLGVGGEAGAAFWSIEDGTGRVYSFDGTTFELISGDMGTGVQVLYAAGPLPQQVIPEVPLGTIVASAAMIIALVAYLTVPKFRKRQISINP